MHACMHSEKVHWAPTMCEGHIASAGEAHSRNPQGRAMPSFMTVICVLKNLWTWPGDQEGSCEGPVGLTQGTGQRAERAVPHCITMARISQRHWAHWRWHFWLPVFLLWCPPGSSAFLYTTQMCPTWAVVPVRSCSGGPGACLSSDTSSLPWRTTLPVNSPPGTLGHWGVWGQSRDPGGASQALSFLSSAVWGHATYLSGSRAAWPPPGRGSPRCHLLVHNSTWPLGVAKHGAHFVFS